MVLSQELIEEIQRQPTYMVDERFYRFVNKVARAREANMFACMRKANETDLRILTNTTEPGYYELTPDAPECREVCEDVLTEDEWLMIKNADCGHYADEYEPPAGMATLVSALHP